jgi:hypothetical protein
MKRESILDKKFELFDESTMDVLLNDKPAPKSSQ